MSRISFEEAARAWMETKSDRLAAKLLRTDRRSLQRILSSDPYMVSIRSSYHDLQRRIRGPGGRVMTGKEIELFLRLIPDSEKE